MGFSEGGIPLQQPMPTDKEIFLSNRSMITETDVEGRIVYADHNFLETTGYLFHELLGMSHSIIRHPDMPKTVFTEMWDTIEQGENWYGYIKNLTKDGSFFWSHVNIMPRWDEYGKIIGFIASRKAAPKDVIEIIADLYAKLVEIEKTEGIDASEKYLNAFLLEKGKDIKFENIMDEIYKFY